MTLDGTADRVVDGEGGEFPIPSAQFSEIAKTSPFEETLTVSRTSLISLSSVYPLSELRNITTGTVTHTGAEYEVGVDSVLESAEIGRYVPGYAAECGVGIRLAPHVAGQVTEWGYFDDDDGLFFRRDADGLKAVVRRSGSDSDALIDHDADLADGFIWQIRFTWYGYGLVEWRLVDTRGGRQRVKTLHTRRVAGSVSVDNPNLPIRVRNAGAGSVFVGGRQFSIVGSYRPNRRINAADAQSVSIDSAADFIPICSFRRQNTDDAKPVTLLADGFSLTTDQAVEVVILVGTTLTDASWVAPEFSGFGTAIEVDESATALSGGQLLFRDIAVAEGSGGNKRGDEDETLRVRIPRLEPVTLAARHFGTAATVHAVLRAQEEW